MDFLRFGAVGLSSAEDALVATLFRLHRVDPSFIWTRATEAPFDALLIDSRCDADAYEHLMGRDTQIVRLGDIDSALPGQLPRPIRSDLLVRWLNSIEIQILHGSKDPFASTSIESRLGPHSHAPRSILPVPATPAVPTAHLPVLNPGTRVKLRRWPSHALLGGDVSRIRMATMLSRRALTLEDLVAATGVATHHCLQFVGALRHAGLLEMAVPEIAPTPALPAAAAKDQSPTTRGIGRSLLRSIRQRFGL